MHPLRLRQARLDERAQRSRLGMSRQMAAGLRPPPSGIKNAREAGVCFIQGPPPGSGVLVSWRGHSCILTNQHVVGDEAAARGNVALFGYDDYGNKDTAVRCPLLPEPGSLFHCSPYLPPIESKQLDADHLDYALVHVDVRALPPNVQPLVLWPGPDALRPDWRMGQAWVVGHPDGGPRLTDAKGLKEGSDGLSAEHNAFTEGGSSGSPVFLYAEGVPLLGIHCAHTEWIRIW